MDELVKHMVDRFLGWQLPENFNPDNGISFKPTFNDHLPVPMKCNPTGTNLFDAQQAEAMVRYMLEGKHFPPSVPVSRLSKLLDDAYRWHWDETDYYKAIYALIT